jgi:HEAT repeat protein
MVRPMLVFAALLLAGWGPAAAERQSQQPTAGRWALVIGSDRWPEVVAAQRGASAALRERYGYAPANVIEIYGRDVTHAGIRRQLGDLGDRIRPSDSVFVYAMLPAADVYRAGADYFLAADSQPGEVWTLIGRDEFEEAVSVIPASSSLLVVNSCVETPRAPRSRASTMQTQAVLKGGTGRGSTLSFCDRSASDRGARQFADAFTAMLQSGADPKGRLSDTELEARLRERLAGMSVTLDRAAPRAEGFEFVVDRRHGDTLLQQLRTQTTPQGQVQAIEALSTLMRSTPDNQMRAAVLRELARVGGDPSIQLVPRLRAIGALGESGLPAAAPELGLLAAKDSGAEIRRAALAALARIPSPDASRLMLAALKDPDPTVRAAAVRGAGGHRHLNDAAPIVAAIGDPAADVQVAALQVVSILARPQLVGRNLMTPHLANARRATQRALASSSPDVQREAVNTLALLGVDLARRDVPALSILTGAGDSSVRVTVAYTLGREFRGVWEDPGSGTDRYKLNEQRQPALMALIRVADPANAAPADVRAAAIWSLGEIGDPRGQAVLMRELDDPDMTVREAAMEALGKMRHLPAMPAIASGLRHESPRIRAAAARSLGLMRAPGASEPLQACLAIEKDVYVRGAVEEALHRLPSPSLEKVAAALASESPKVRVEAVEGLDKVKDPAAAQLAIDALGDPDFDVRKAALEVLTERSDDWFSAIADPSIVSKPSAVRFGAAVVLGRIGTPAAGTALLQFLDREGNPVVKAAVVTSLGAVPAAGEIEAALLRVVQEADPSLRAAAASAFGNHSSPAVQQALQTLADDEEPEVRDRAIATLRKIAK